MKEILEAQSFIRSLTAFESKIGIILGTGLGGLTTEMQVEVEIPYESIPHFPLATVESHTGRLLFGTISSKKVVVMQGRFHFYEGYSMQQVVFPVRVLKLLGVDTLLISNAAGGLNPDHQISDLMVINDHINLLPENPLQGPNLDELGPRFPDMSLAYDKILINKALEIGREMGYPVHEGVYASVSGPNLETPAEYRYIRILGADAVGMSTIPEVIAAVHMGMRIFAVSVITDLGIDGKIEHVTVEKVLAAAKKAEPKLTYLISRLLATI